MDQVLTLALPFFGLIFIGYFCGRLKKIPHEGFAWLNFFIVYVSLPAMFFQLLARTPIEQLANWAFVIITTASTYTIFAVAFAIGIWATRRDVAQSTIVALAGAYSNIGYMGPGLTLAALGPAASVPTALIFCFDNIMHFTMAPLLMGVAGRGGGGRMALALGIVKRIFTHPFIIATIVSIGAAAIQFQPPAFIDRMLVLLAQAAAPCALFTLGVTVALRPMGRIPVEMPLVLLLKLVVHPLLVYLLLDWYGGFDRVWIMTAVLMAALPPALNVFVIAQQYGVYVERASTVVLVGTLISVLTVTGTLYLITHDMIPTGLLRGATP